MSNKTPFSNSRYRELPTDVSVKIEQLINTLAASPSSHRRFHTLVAAMMEHLRELHMMELYRKAVEEEDDGKSESESE